MGRKAKEYALYRGDEFLDIGTKKELCERHGVPFATLEHLTTREAKLRYSGHGLCLVSLDGGEEEGGSDGKA